MASSRPTHKVFGIGFHKTGTTTLNLALRRLGYRVTGPNGAGDPEIAVNALPMALRLVEEYDAFQDNPWPILFRELDERVPGAKFILTVRDPERWLASQVEHFGTSETPMRRWIYGPDAGAPVGHEQRYLERYDEHNRSVREHFAQRPDDLLELDVSTAPGWGPLCDFLGRPVPRSAFPHANKGTTRSWRQQHPVLSEGRKLVGRTARRLRRHG